MVDPRIESMRRELGAMGKVLDVLEQLENDEQRLRVMCCACLNLGHYQEAQRFLAELVELKEAAGDG